MFRAMAKNYEAKHSSKTYTKCRRGYQCSGRRARPLNVVTYEFMSSTLYSCACMFLKDVCNTFVVYKQHIMPERGKKKTTTTTSAHQIQLISYDCWRWTGFVHDRALYVWFILVFVTFLFSSLLSLWNAFVGCLFFTYSIFSHLSVCHMPDFIICQSCIPEAMKETHLMRTFSRQKKIHQKIDNLNDWCFPGIHSDDIPLIFTEI